MNIRVYPSTRDTMNQEADKQGKTMARVNDEKWNPEKYIGI